MSLRWLRQVVRYEPLRNCIALKTFSSTTFPQAYPEGTDHPLTCLLDGPFQTERVVPNDSVPADLCP